MFYYYYYFFRQFGRSTKHNVTKSLSSIREQKKTKSKQREKTPNQKMKKIDEITESKNVAIALNKEKLMTIVSVRDFLTFSSFRIIRVHTKVDRNKRTSERGPNNEHDQPTNKKEKKHIRKCFMTRMS